MKMPPAPGGAAEIFDGSRMGWDHRRSQPCHLLGGDGVGLDVLWLRYSIRLQGLGGPLGGLRGS